MAYIPYNPNPSGNYVGDCVIRAISKVTGKDWDDAYVGLADTVEEAKEIIYSESLNDFAEKGHFKVGGAPKEMRFAGSEFIRECVDYLFSCDGEITEIADAKNWEGWGK